MSRRKDFQNHHEAQNLQSHVGNSFLGNVSHGIRSLFNTLIGLAIICGLGFGGYLWWSQQNPVNTQPLDGWEQSQ